MQFYPTAHHKKASPMATSKNKKPTATPATPFPTAHDSLHRNGCWLWIPLCKEWRDVTTKPEEVVRQKFIRALIEHYGYDVEQMLQEQRTQSGNRSPRVDIVVFETVAAKKAKPRRSPVLVVECKTDGIEIQERDYYQGESYTRAVGCEFFVATNIRHTSVFRLLPGLPGSFVAINEIPKATDWGDAKRLKEIKDSLRAFNRKEFQDLLLGCHNILRDVHKMDPGRAFDTISKILFIKMYIERSGQHGTFSTDYLDRRAAVRLQTDPAVHDSLFDQTKTYYQADELFTAADKLDIAEHTFSRIVKALERFDLAKTGDDIKGLAFERFLGTTFRGELGQFFTPRPVVEFMVDLLNPAEGELVCDPAAGSGGFLIRAFEHVRALIQRDIQEKKDAERDRIEALKLPEEEEEQQIEAAFAAFNQELLPSGSDNKPIDTRVGRLAWQCIYGTDAEPRAARTAKMNMVMHGDGHGGIHYHDGLVDINGIFDGRFDVVLTNPPFGSNVGKDQMLGGSEEARIPTDPAYIAACKKRYGKVWEENHNRLLLLETEGTTILDLFEIGAGKANRPTELIFVERCLNLLKPGGRMGIVLPDGNLNNPSLAWLRRYAEGRAKLLAVVGLPEETFRSSDATVKASLVFMTKFTDVEAAAWEAAWDQARQELDPSFDTQRDELYGSFAQRIVCGDDVAVGVSLAELAKLGVMRGLPKWTHDEPLTYPRCASPTLQAKPMWAGKPTAKDKAAAAQLKRNAQAALAVAAKASDLLLSELKAKYRKVDIAHTAALWVRVREQFDYPVFVAAPKTVGISSTGETGDGVTNDLTSTLTLFRQFEKWLDKGASLLEQPNFPEPSTA
jgi:type I restriction enzyme M protein